MNSNFYITMVYLYITIAFSIIYLFFNIFKNNTSIINFNHRLIPFIILLLCIFAINGIPVEYFIIKHFIWLIFLLLNAYILFPLYINTDSNIFNITFFTTIIITILLSLLIYLYPELIQFSIGPILLYILLTIIVFSILNIVFVKDISEKYKNQKWISLISIILFSIFILYDTKVLLYKAKFIKNPDYIKDSINLFLDILNFFINLLFGGGGWSNK